MFVEAESFADPGGWVLDTQFIQIMGSPYLLAHGLGEPVGDAVTTVTFPETGRYRVFVRTKDWVARWNAPGTPGKFQLIVDGKPLAETFGTKGADWHWHEGGEVSIEKRQVEVRLHDLAGFGGRCDAILFAKHAAYVPPNGNQPHAAWRQRLLGLPDEQVATDQFDLVVVGGGYSGCGTAISAARMGLKVALIQDRAVRGGNSRSEVRVWPQGKTPRGLF
ncbi:MAG: FAD-dependent oxidoreductase, partial [Pirellulales bacterium]|nr:FAD-dependent oxidoreductase [Pirellulales bacterium]